MGERGSRPQLLDIIPDLKLIVNWCVWKLRSGNTGPRMVHMISFVIVFVDICQRYTQMIPPGEDIPMAQFETGEGPTSLLKKPGKGKESLRSD